MELFAHVARLEERVALLEQRLPLEERVASLEQRLLALEGGTTSSVSRAAGEARPRPAQAAPTKHKLDSRKQRVWALDPKRIQRIRMPSDADGETAAVREASSGAPATERDEAVKVRPPAAAPFGLGHLDGFLDLPSRK